jgi:ABC-2 type transport system ATP-binding protein
MIEIRSLTFSYDDLYVFENLNLQFKPNLTTIVLGKNGTGKTTLFQLIANILEPAFGTIEKKDDVIFIPDEPMLYEYLTGYEYLEYIKVLSKHQLNDKVIDLQELLDMKPHMSKLIHEMSLGMKHKLALMSAMYLNYETYVIDEPLTALDPPSQKEMIAIFKKMKALGKTLIISTHMIHIAYQLADEVIVLNGKEIFTIKNDYDNYQDFEDIVLNHFMDDVKEDSDV